MFIQECQHWEANLESEMFIFKVLATYHLSQHLGGDKTVITIKVFLIKHSTYMHSTYNKI